MNINNVATGSNFSASDLLVPHTLEGNNETIFLSDIDIPDKKPFSISDIKTIQEQEAVNLIKEKLGISAKTLEHYDSDTVAGLMEIVKAMKDLEENNASDTQRMLLTYADDFFSQLYSSALDTISILDGIGVSNAVNKFKKWINENEDRFDEEQKAHLNNSFFHNGIEKTFNANEENEDIKIYDVFGSMN